MGENQESPLVAEQEILNALKTVVQRVVDFDTRIISISIKAGIKRGEPMSVEINVGRTQEH